MEKSVRPAGLDPDLPFMEDWEDHTVPDQGTPSNDEMTLYMEDGTVLEALSDEDSVCGLGIASGPCHFADPVKGPCDRCKHCSWFDRKDCRSVFWVKKGEFK